MSRAQSLLLEDPSQFRSLSRWDVDFRQIEPGEMKTRVAAWEGADLSMIDLSFDKSVHQAGTSRQGYLAFGLPDPGSLKTWLGSSVEGSPLMVFGTDQPFEGASSNAFSGITFAVKADRAMSIANSCCMDASHVLDLATHSSMSQLKKAHAGVRHMARRIIAQGAKARSSANEEDFILFLLEMLSSVQNWTESKDANRRVRATQLAAEIMFDRLDDCVSIPHICSEVGVSPPTLRRGFLETYGVSPKQFYLRARLSKVRTELATGSRFRSIADVANDFGFWHMGQFAKDYRSFFGELPSQTGV
jgi:AraC-like DNA-binding protein